MRLRPQYWLMIALAVVLGAAALLSMHAVRHAIRLRLATGPVRPWMSIPYIARTHHVPPDVLYEAAGLPPERRDHRPIGRIARRQGRPVGELIAKLESAIAQAHGHNPSKVNRGVP